MQISIYILIVAARCAHTSPSGILKDVLTFSEDGNIPLDLSSPDTALYTPPDSKTFLEPVQVAQDWIYIPGLGVTNKVNVDSSSGSEPKPPSQGLPNSPLPAKPQSGNSPDSQGQEPTLSTVTSPKLPEVVCKVFNVRPLIQVKHTSS